MSGICGWAALAACARRVLLVLPIYAASCEHGCRPVAEPCRLVTAMRCEQPLRCFTRAVREAIPLRCLHSSNSRWQSIRNILASLLLRVCCVATISPPSTIGWATLSRWAALRFAGSEAQARAALAPKSLLPRRPIPAHHRPVAHPRSTSHPCATPVQALKYYERSKHLLASGPVPKAERSALSRSRRAELLVHVTKRLEVIVAGAQRDEGGSTLVAGARARFASLSCEGEARLAEGEPLQALLAYEQALELGRSHLSLEEGGQLVVADTLTKLAEVHAFLGDAAQVEAHARAAIDLLNDVPSPGALLPRTPAERRVLTSNGHAEGTSQSGSSSPATPVDLSRGPERAEASGSDARQGRLSHLQAVLAQLETPSPARRTSTPRGGLGAAATAAGAGSAATGMLSPPVLRMSVGSGRVTLTYFTALFRPRFHLPSLVLVRVWIFTSGRGCDSMA